MTAGSSYTLEPRVQPAGADASIAACVTRDEAKRRIVVVPMITRAADAPPVHASEVRVWLVDAAGRDLTLVERPSGILGEGGGSLGMSASGIFVFVDAGAAPRRLGIGYRDVSVVFSVVEGA
jgi:hypothetical protein